METQHSSRALRLAAQHSSADKFSQVGGLGKNDQPVPPNRHQVEPLDLSRKNSRVLQQTLSSRNLNLRNNKDCHETKNSILSPQTTEALTDAGSFQQSPSTRPYQRLMTKTRSALTNKKDPATKETNRVYSQSLI